MELGELWTQALGEGLDPANLTAAQTALRAVLVYILLLAIIRLAKKRFLARASAFDVVVGIIVGSIASRAITGNAPIIPSVAATAAIVVLHWLFSALAIRSHTFGILVKGRSRVLIRDGEIDERALRVAHMSSRDLDEALRLQGVGSSASVREARLERDGSVSVISR